MKVSGSQSISRRGFLKNLTGGVAFSIFNSVPDFSKGESAKSNELFHVYKIPDDPFIAQENSNYHAGIETLLFAMASKGLKFYRSDIKTALSGRRGLIEPDDVVLIKVNAQWKYRGCTNSDLIRGLVQRILDHPDTFRGEIVILENGQGRGSLNCDTQTRQMTYPDRSVHANANDEEHSFLYLVGEIFNDPRVSAYLLDPIRNIFIDDQDHLTDGYRIDRYVSYPCFTSFGGRRIELKQGVWNGNGYSQNLKLINVPVLKHHDVGGSEITGALKHFYGLVTMKDGYSRLRHYSGLGYTCGTMVATVCTPVLNIMDAIWVSHASLAGYPERKTFRANQIVASQDPVALDYWAARHILYPIDKNHRHHPRFFKIDKWLRQAMNTINQLGGLRDVRKGILVDQVTKDEREMLVHSEKTRTYVISGKVTLAENQSALAKGKGLGGVVLNGLPGSPVTNELGRFKAHVFAGWSGKIYPEKKGFIFKPRKRTFSSVYSPQRGQNFTALNS